MHEIMQHATRTPATASLTLTRDGLPQTMRALVKLRPGPGIELCEVKRPSPGTNEVLIQVWKTAICGTDNHIYQWDRWAMSTLSPPLIIGHEFCGQIVQCGTGVTRVKPGQIVSGEGHVVGTESRNFREGLTHLAPDTNGVGVNRDGAFAEYLVLPDTNVVPLPEGMNTDIGALLDPFGNAVHTAMAFEVAAEEVLVTGAGTIGILAALVAQQIGARCVVVSEPNPERRALAKSAGAKCVIDPFDGPIHERLADLGAPDGFSVGLEMSGSSHGLDAMIAAMNPGGSIAMLGLPSEPATFDWSPVVMKALTVRGIYGREMYRTWRRMFALLESGLDITPVITHRLPVSAYQQGFELMAEGKCGKVILDWR